MTIVVRTRCCDDPHALPLLLDTLAIDAVLVVDAAVEDSDVDVLDMATAAGDTKPRLPSMLATIVVFIAMR